MQFFNFKIFTNYCHQMVRANRKFQQIDYPNYFECTKEVKRH